MTQGPSGPSERGAQGPSGPSERGAQGPSGPSERGAQGPPPGPSRRQARERALALLYEAEVKQVPPATVLRELSVQPDRFASELVAGVGEHVDEIDAYLRDYAREWRVERMPALDRALLRIGVFELVHRLDVPTGVAISEAVELAQLFSTNESARFVNGMLARIAEAVRPVAEGA